MRVLFVLDQLDYEPQGIMQLSAVLKAAGHDVKLAIAASEDPVQVARDYRPGLIGYSVITGSQRYYLALNRRLREFVPAFSMFGGPHPTFFPEMVEHEGVDGICVGEGDGAIVDLANELDTHGRVENAQILNWHFHLDGQVIRNPVRPYVADLDALPSPDYDLVYEADRVTRRSKIKHFLAGRGCPYGCTYCFNHALVETYRGKGKHVRHRDPARVVEDLLQVRSRYPLEFAVFVDDTFILSQEWLERFAREYRRVGLPFFCNVRANLVTADIVRLLKSAGCHSVSMGIEAGNDAIRDDLLHRNLSREQILGAAALLRSGGLRFTTTSMIGLPDTTLDNDLETLDLNIACRPDYAHVFLFQPYPRTVLGQYAADKGLLEGTFDDISATAWDSSILKFSPAHKRALTNLQRLFAIVVEQPRLRSRLRPLLRLPPNRLYWLANKLWKGYAIKQRVHPVRTGPAELLASAWRFMRIKS
ncbi:MAG: B12-binding domain-containing radical SAM protein [Anaerolineae bacterium]